MTIMAPGLAVLIIEKQHSPCDRLKTACIHIEPRPRRLPPTTTARHPVAPALAQVTGPYSTSSASSRGYYNNYIYYVGMLDYRPSLSEGRQIDLLAGESARQDPHHVS